MRLSHILTVSLTALTLSLAACGDQSTGKPESKVEAPAVATVERTIKKDDKFTYANYDQIQTTHLDLDLDVKFDSKVLEGMATLDFKRIDPEVDEIVLDTKDLLIKAVGVKRGEEWVPGEYSLGDDDELLGQKLTIALAKDATKVRIAYRTSPEAEGLQWLSPEPVSYTHLTLPTKA